MIRPALYYELTLLIQTTTSAWEFTKPSVVGNEFTKVNFSKNHAKKDANRQYDIV